MAQTEGEPKGLWIKCNYCREILYHREVSANLDVCPRCGYHFRISATRRLELLFDNQADPYQTQDLAADPGHAAVRERFRGAIQDRMAVLGDRFEACSWYRDHWTADRVIVCTATLRKGAG